MRLFTLALLLVPVGSPGIASGQDQAPKQADMVTVPQLRERAVSMLVDTAEVVSTDPRQNELRANALEALIPLPGRLEPVARKAMRDASLGVRAVAVMAAGKAKLRNLVENIRPMASDNSNLVKASSIFALSKLGSPVDPTPLATLLMVDEPVVKSHAAFVLGELGNTSAIPMLLEAAGAPGGRSDPTKDRLARLQIAEALVKLGQKDAIHEIRAALYPGRPEDLEATALAVQLLGQLNDEASASQLRNLTNEKYDAGGAMPAEVRLGAALSLAQMRDISFVWVADQYASNPSAPLRAQAAAVYGASRDQQHAGKLAAMLNDTDPTVKIAAAAAIIKLTEGR